MTQSQEIPFQLVHITDKICLASLTQRLQSECIAHDKLRTQTLAQTAYVSSQHKLTT